MSNIKIINDGIIEFSNRKDNITVVDVRKIETIKIERLMCGTYYVNFLYKEHGEQLEKADEEDLNIIKQILKNQNSKEVKI